MAIAHKPTDFGALKHYQRALTHFFETNDLKRVGRCLDQASLGAYIERNVASTKDHLRPGWDLPESALKSRTRTVAWLRDSLLWTIEELLAIENNADAEKPYVYALRGLLQVAQYAGEVGHDSTTSDAYNVVKNVLENACEFASRGDSQ